MTHPVPSSDLKLYRVEYVVDGVSKYEMVADVSPSAAADRVRGYGLGFVVKVENDMTQPHPLVMASKALPWNDNASADAKVRCNDARGYYAAGVAAERSRIAAWLRSIEQAEPRRHWACLIASSLSPETE